MSTSIESGRRAATAARRLVETLVNNGAAADDLDRVVGRVTYGHQYEGPPGCVHGGMLAAAFDIVLAVSAAKCGRMLVTGTLSVRYRRPTPLATELRFEGELVGIEGRKVRSSATVCGPDGESTAEAEGIFLIVDDDRYRPDGPA